VYLGRRGAEERGVIRRIAPRLSAFLSSVRTLGEIAAHTSMLQVACSRCVCRGRYRLDNLIARHGADAGVRVIVLELTADPQREWVALMERCDILFPDLRALFRRLSAC
jgi:hypothetical protein